MDISFALNWIVMAALTIFILVYMPEFLSHSNRPIMYLRGGSFQLVIFGYCYFGSLSITIFCSSQYISTDIAKWMILPLCIAGKIVFRKGKI